MIEFAGSVLFLILKTIAIVATVSLTLFWTCYFFSPADRRSALWDQWLRFGHAAGAFNSRVILTIFYILVITPYAVVLRLNPGFDPLHIRRRTTWLARRTQDVNIADSTRQF